MWLLMVSVIIGGVLGVVTHVALLRLSPRWTSTAMFEFSGLIMEIDDVQNSIGAGSLAETEMFIATETQKMISRPILMQAVQDSSVRVDTNWQKQFVTDGTYDPNIAFLELEEIVRARSIRDTAFAKLSVTTPNPVDSAIICQAILRAYMDRVRSERTIESSDVLEVLSGSLAGIQEEKKLIEDQMDRLWTESDLPGLDASRTVEQHTIDRITLELTDARQELEMLREQYDSYQEQLNSPGGVTYPEIVRQIVDEGPIISNFKYQIAGLKAGRRSSMESLGQNHREVRRLDQQIQGVESEMDAQRQVLLAETFNGLIETTQLQISSFEAADADMMENMNEASQKMADIERLQEQYKTLENEAESLAERESETADRISKQRSIGDRQASTRVSVFSQPEEPDEPSFPIIYVMVPMVMLLVVGLVSGIIVLRELLEQRIRSAADASLIPQLRVIGMIPDISEDPAGVKSIETVVRDQPLGIISESIREIRNTVGKRMASRGHKTLLVATGMPDSGGTSIIANLAASFAATEKRVLIIDANFRRPRIHEVMGVSLAPGLTDVLTGASNIADAAMVTGVSGVEVLPSGTPDATGYERLTTDAMSKALVDASDQYDIVLVDSPPAVVSNDATNLANRCDASLMVVRAYHEKRGLIARVRRQLDESNSEFLGVVINAVKSSAGGYFKRNFQVAHEYNNPTEPKPVKQRKRKTKKGKDDMPEREHEEVGAGRD